MTIAAPGGSVTLMFTDIEGSTHLLERLREGYAVVLEQHRDLLRSAFATYHGYEVDTQGDSFFVAFGTAHEAISCAIEIQRSVAAHDWPGAADLRIRIGLHTGEPTLATTGYVGVDVHRGARIGAAANGGQVLVSRATRDAVDGSADGAAFEDLGVHRFKGLSEPTAVFGLVADGLSTNFPPIRASAPEDEVPAPGDPPYKGLLRFEQDDAEWFFGREELVAEIAGAIRAEPFIAVVGASGSGKSSLVRAGVLAALSRDGSVFDRVIVMTPTDDPAAGLAAATAQEGGVSVEELAAAGLGTLLVVDQLEELFTLTRDVEARDSFISSLISSIGPSLHVVVTLRADFYAEVAAFPELRQKIAEHQFFIGPMQPADLRRAIEEPARRGGWDIAPGLVDLLLRDVGNEPGALPLLSHALLETWRRRRGSRMTLKSYFESGEVRGAIARTADRLYGELPTEERALARNILLRLTELGEGAQDTRRRAALEELVPAGGSMSAGPTSEVLRRLVDARLVTVDEGAAEVAHEALIREWPLLREWLQDDREGLRVQRQIADAAAEWNALGQEPSLLFRGARLAAAREWSDAHPGVLNDRERRFVDASVEAEAGAEHERTEQQRRELEAAQRAAEAERKRAEEQTAAARRLRRRAAVLAGAVLVAAGLGVAAVIFAGQANEQAAVAQAQTEIAMAERAEAERQRVAADEQRTQAEEQRSLAEQRRVEAETQRNEAVSRGLAAQAMTNLSALDLSLLLSLEAGRHADTIESRQSLLTGLLAQPQLLSMKHLDGRGRLVFHDDARVVAWNFEGRLSTLAVVDGNQLSFQSEFEVAAGFEGQFNRDGSLIAIMSDDGQTTVWSVALGEQVADLGTCPGVPGSVLWSPTSNALAVSCPDELLTVHDLDSDGQTEFPVRHAVHMAFAPDGRMLAVMTEELTSETLTYRVEVWDTTTGDAIDQLPAFETPGPSEMAWSPDGKLLAIPVSLVDGHRTLELWAAERRQLIDPIVLPRTGDRITPEDYYPTAIAFSPDGSLLVATHIDGGSVWELTGRTMMTSLTGCNGELVSDPSFRADGRFLAAHCWSNPFLDGHSIVVYDVAAEVGPELTPIELAPGAPEVVDFQFAQGGTLVTLAQGEGSTISLWDVQNSDRLAREARALPTDAPAFVSPDGSIVALYEDDGTVTLARAGEGGQVSQHLCTPSGGESGFGVVSMSASAAVLACGVYDQTEPIDVFERSTGALLASVPTPSGAGGLTALELSADGEFLALGYVSSQVTEPALPYSSLMVWSVVENRMLVEREDEQAVRPLAFSADGGLLASARGSDLVVWETNTWTEVATLTGHLDRIGDAAFSADGALLASGAFDNSVILWDTATWEQSGPRLTGHRSFVTEVRFSPTRLLASTDFSYSTLLWDVEHRLAIGPLTGAFPLGFASDGKSLIARSTEERAELFSWTLHPPDWREIACRTANRNLTQEEWQRYLPGEDYRETCP